MKLTLFFNHVSCIFLLDDKGREQENEHMWYDIPCSVFSIICHPVLWSLTVRGPKNNQVKLSHYSKSFLWQIIILEEIYCTHVKQFVFMVRNIMSLVQVMEFLVLHNTSIINGFLLIMFVSLFVTTCRGYYRCSSSKACPARKQVERSRTDPNMLVITYTSDHNHPWPTH